MRRGVAKNELRRILDKQKSVQVDRLSKLLKVLNYEKMEKDYVEQGKRIKELKTDLKQHKDRVREQREEINSLYKKIGVMERMDNNGKY